LRRQFGTAFQHFVAVVLFDEICGVVLVAVLGDFGSLQGTGDLAFETLTVPSSSTSPVDRAGTIHVTDSNRIASSNPPASTQRTTPSFEPPLASVSVT
jgi:hypothetical protein